MRYKNKKTATSIISGLLMFFLFVSPVLADFNPGILIADDVFSNTQSFSGASGIQQFLSSKDSPLANTDPSFLLMLKEPQVALQKSGLNDPEPNLPYLRSAAQLIWDASQMTGINPQVILVTLQKEQSLITGNFSDNSSLQSALNHALGFSCPDSGGCSSTLSGFYFQLFGNFDTQGNHYIGAPASLMRSFNTTNGRGPMVDASGSTFGSSLARTSQVGDTILLQNTQGPPNNAPATQQVTIGDKATAALYRYTPHVYNGNYNFWKFFTSWFKYDNGTLIRIIGSSDVYIVNNGQMSLMPNFVMMSHGINVTTANIQTIAQSDFSSYTLGPIYAPSDNSIVKIQGDTTGTYYVFENGVKHPASPFVISQRNLDVNASFTVSLSDANLFQTGTQLTPADGTLIQPAGSKTVYVAQNSEIYALTGFTFKQYGYSFSNLATLPVAEVNSYENGGFLLPKDGTLIKFADSGTVYILKDKMLQPISGTVFNLYGYSFKNVNTIDKGELASATQGPFLTPPDGTYYYVVSNGVKSYYYFKNSSIHSVSAFVLKQRKINNAVALSANESAALSIGDPLPPIDGTIVKGDSSAAIYVITNGQKIALDYNTWVKTYKKKAPNVLPQSEIDSYQTPSSVQIQQ
jgi:hypothetical protein